MFTILLQSGKAGDLASAFGGATTQTAFGARGAATFLSKATTICAVLFMVTSLGLSITYIRGSKGSLMQSAPAASTPAATAPAPAAPEKTPQSTPPQQQSPAPQK
jgi:preprotein translocase subunit SecG